MAAPANDLCANATVISSLPFQETVDIRDATTSVGDPTNTPTNSIWYQWTCPTSGDYIWDMVGSFLFRDTSASPQTGVATIRTMIVQGTCGGTWTTIANSGSWSNRPWNSPARIKFTATAGQTYYLIAGTGTTNNNLAERKVNVRLMAAPAAPTNDLCVNAIDITSTPYSNTQNTIGQTKSADDPIENKYWGDRVVGVWYKFTPSVSKTYRIDASGSDYEVLLSIWSTGTCGSLGGELAGTAFYEEGSQLNVALTAGTTYFIWAAGQDSTDGIGYAGSLTLNVYDPSAPSPNCTAATAISSIPYSTTVDTTGFSSNILDPLNSEFGYRAFNPKYFSFTPSESGTYKIDTNGSSFNTVISVYSGSCGALTEVQNSSGLVTAQGSNASVTVSLTAGTTYFFIAGGQAEGGGDLHLSVTKLTTPTISVISSSNNVVVLGWTGSIRPTFQYCTGDLCSGFTFFPFVGTYDDVAKTWTIDRGIRSGTVYRFRAYISEPATVFTNTVSFVTDSTCIHFPPNTGVMTILPTRWDPDLLFSSTHAPYTFLGMGATGMIWATIDAYGDRTFVDAVGCKIDYHGDGFQWPSLLPMDHEHQSYVWVGVRDGYLSIDICVDYRFEDLGESHFGTRHQKLFVSTARLTPGQCYHVAWNLHPEMYVFQSSPVVDRNVLIELFLDGVLVLSDYISIASNLTYGGFGGPGGISGFAGEDRTFAQVPQIGFGHHVGSTSTANPNGDGITVSDPYITESVGVTLARFRQTTYTSVNTSLTQAEIITEKNSPEIPVSSKCSITNQVGLFAAGGNEKYTIPNWLNPNYNAGTAPDGISFYGTGQSTVPTCWPEPSVTAEPPPEEPPEEEPDNTPTPEPGAQTCETGVSANLIGGAVKGVLVDTGVVVGVSEAPEYAQGVVGGGTTRTLEEVVALLQSMIDEQKLAQLQSYVGVEEGEALYNSGTVPSDEASLITAIGQSDYDNLRGGVVSDGAQIPTTLGPRYSFSGHTLRRINQVYVLKPDPTLVEGDELFGTPQQILQVEGVDYYQEVIEVNGNRYHTIVFYQPQQADACTFYEVTANIEGVEYNADGSGDLIQDGIDIVKHVCLNWIWNSYRSSAGQFAPPGGKWFEDVISAPGTLDKSSFDTVRAIAATLVSGGYKGFGSITEPIEKRELLMDLIRSFGIDLFFDINRGNQGAWAVDLFVPDNVNRASISQNWTPTGRIVKDSFVPYYNRSGWYNVIQYFAGPLPKSSTYTSQSTNGFYISGEFRDPPSIQRFGELIAPQAKVIKWSRDYATVYDVIKRDLKLARYCPIFADLTAPPEVTEVVIGSMIKLTHPDGFSEDGSGWDARVVRLYGADFDMEQQLVKCLVRDVDGIVP